MFGSNRIVVSGLLALALLTAGAIVAQESAVTHQVVDGDTLWDLAGRYLQNGFSWPLIWEANKDKVTDPHWIYPGQEIIIPAQGATGPVAAPDDAAVTLPEPPPEEQPEPVHSKPKVSSSGIRFVETAKPVVAEGLAFSSGYISPDEDKPMGHIVSRHHTQPEYLTSNDVVYVNVGTRDGVRPGDRFIAYRASAKPVKHPITKSALGKMIRIIAVIKVDEVQEKVSKGMITKVCAMEPITPDEAIMPYADVMVPKGVKPLPAQTTQQGCIIAFKDGDPDYTNSAYQVAYIDKGLADGIMPGDIFEIYRAQKPVKDPDRKDGNKVNLPERVIGRLQVLATRNATSSVYLTQTVVDDIKPGELIRLIKKVSH